MKRALVLFAVLILAACSSVPRKSPSSARAHGDALASGEPGQAGRCVRRYWPPQEDPSTRGHYTPGGLYRPGVADTVPANVPDVGCIAEPAVRAEARSHYGNRSPYTVLGRTYQVLDTQADYVQDGVASFYGQKFHGRKTSNHEVYDMYQFTAAHRTLPLPSFALVTNLDNGKSVVVRINDRGPFHKGRLIDLSYAAAVKLEITAQGTGRVRVRALRPDDPALPALLAGRDVASPKTTVATGSTRLNPALGMAAPAQAEAPAAQLLASGAVIGVRDTPRVAQADTDRTGIHRDNSAAHAGDHSSADAFYTWMQASGIHVATGQPAFASPSAGMPAPVTSAVLPPAATVLASIQPPLAAPAADAGVHRVVLQVASFSSRGNAQKALERLIAAGIGDASLSDTIRDGQPLWRLRVDADSAAASGLSGRIAALGFGQPKVVRE